MPAKKRAQRMSPDKRREQILDSAVALIVDRGLSNYWVACGVMAGFSQGGGVGLALSRWMVDGDPGADIWAMDVARYGDWATRAYTNAKVRENYSRRFRIRFPNEELDAARPLRTTPIYERLQSHNAVFGEYCGLEHPLWFAPQGTPPRELVSFRRSNAHAVVGEDLVGLAKHLSPPDHGAAILVADEDVLGDVEIRKQQRLLINGGDAEPLRLGGAANRDWLAAQKDLAAIGLMYAGYDLDERRLAGAVLAKQGMNLTGVQRKRDVLQRLCRVETLGDSTNLQDRRDDYRSVGKPQPFAHPANVRRSRRLLRQ